jgi:valyl-tRNA synthetase
VTEVLDGTGLFLTSTKYQCWLNIDQTTAKAYLHELEQQQAKQSSMIQQLEARLANKSYVDNAPKQIVEQTKDQLVEAQRQLSSLKTEQQRFNV